MAPLATYLLTCEMQARTAEPDVLQQEKVVVVENVRDTHCSLFRPRKSLQQHLLNVEKDGVEVMARIAPELYCLGWLYEWGVAVIHTIRRR